MVSSMLRLIGRLGKFRQPVKRKEWKDFEYFDEAWKERIHLMAQFIPPGTQSVLDIGCGKMWLKDELDPNCEYYGLDYIDRGPGSHVADLNKHQFTERHFDTAFVSGCLEYIYDYNWLIKEIQQHCSVCILSYCAVDIFNNPKERISLGWVNHLSEQDIVALFAASNMQLKQKAKTRNANTIFVFSQ